MDFQDERIRAVQDAVRELLPPRNVLADTPTLDVSKPNFHDSKAEFRRELEAVEAAIEALKKVLRAIYPADQDTDESSAQLARRLEAVVVRAPFGG